MQAEFNEKLVKNLPDAYKKSKDSNNFKILEIEEAACNELRSSLRGIFNFYAERPEDEGVLNINNATGKTLDLYGERIGQPRGLANDDKYLLMIKAKIMRNLSNGSLPSIIDALARTFNCNPAEIVIVDGAEPFEVTAEALPLGAINAAGLTASQAVAIVKAMLPVGTLLTDYLITGTLTFGENEGEYDVEAGFADDEGTIGGFFGAAQGEETDTILPI